MQFNYAFIIEKGEGELMRSKLSMIIMLGLCSILFLSGSSLAHDAAPAKTSTVKIAALLPISGELASKGEVRQYAIEKGVEDANRRWNENGAGLQFELIIEDSESNPDTAVEKAQHLFEKGVQIFIAGSSNELERLQRWAEISGAIIISYSSTSPELSVEGDGVFRMVPSDLEQAKALASLLEYEGMYGIVPVYRNDIYGRELAKLVAEEFEQLYGVVSDAVKYEPNHTNWGEVTAAIAEQADLLGIEREHIAVVLIAFDEAADILQHSESLADLRWFGADTVTLSPVILEQEDTAELAGKMQLSGVTFGLPDSAELHALQSKLENHTGDALLPDAMFAYDIPGMLASIIEQLEQPLNGEELQQQMIEGSGSYAGITGWTQLNEYGDRKYYHYDIWAVQKTGEDYNWGKTAKYVRNPGTSGYIQPYRIDLAGSENLQLSWLLGYGDQAYDLERTLTRAEFTYMLMGAIEDQGVSMDEPNVPAFLDAEHIDSRAQTAVAAAQKRGIVTGYGNETFQPNREITWFEAVAMVTNAMGWLVDDGEQEMNEFDAFPAWVKPYLSAAVQRNFIQITDDFAKNITDSFRFEDASYLILKIINGSEE